MYKEHIYKEHMQGNNYFSCHKLHVLSVSTGNYSCHQHVMGKSVNGLDLSLSSAVTIVTLDINSLANGFIKTFSVFPFSPYQVSSKTFSNSPNKGTKRQIFQSKLTDLQRALH